MLLRTNNLPGLKETVYIVPLLEEETPKHITNIQQLREHPLMRVGKVVRRESVDCVGIQFVQDDTPRPEFRRWFRGQAALTTLFMDDVGLVRVMGRLDIESGALIQSVLKTHAQKMREMIISLHEVSSMATTVLTILRAALQQCERDGVDVTCIVGENTFSAQESVSPLLLNTYRQFDQRDKLDLTASIETNDVKMDESISDTVNNDEDTFGVSFEKTSEDVEPLLSSDPETATGPVLIAARNLSSIHRILQPIQDKGFKVETLTRISDATIYLPQKPWSLFFIDFDLEHCEDIAKFASAELPELKSAPWLIIMGPENIEPLVRAAIKLPIHEYLEKPLSDREFQSVLDRTTDELNKLVGDEI
jgi:anti-anti-sigma factor